MKALTYAQTKRVTDAEKNLLFLQREDALKRTPYETERRFFELLRNGELTKLETLLTRAPELEFGIGNMSHSDLRQAQYAAVAFVTLATRMAVEAGIYEAVAYSMSDEFILRIDRMRTAQEVYDALAALTFELAGAKRRADGAAHYPRMIRRAMEYIHLHLHGQITLAALAAECGVSAAYLSRRFHAETGRKLSAYILDEKLAEAASLLHGHTFSCTQIATMLGFSSQSHFTARFKSAYGLTPAAYRQKSV